MTNHRIRALGCLALAVAFCDCTVAKTPPTVEEKARELLTARF